MITNDVINRAGASHSWTFWDGAFTDEELQKTQEYCKNLNKVEATTLGATKKPEPGKEVRISEVAWLKRNSESAWIFDKMNFIIEQSNTNYYGFDLYGYDSLQYTTYFANNEGKYDWHMDSCMDTIIGIGETRKLSVTLLLDDNFEGGEFQINAGTEKYGKTLPAKKGRAIVFPSYMIHRVTPVTRGIRRSLVAWCVGPKFR